jgi:hypothetical protein
MFNEPKDFYVFANVTKNKQGAREGIIKEKS